jgi:two-component system sensor histidine kinase YesM
VENGHLDINVKVNSQDEFGQLSQSFDNMVVKLKDYMDKEFNEQKKKSEMKFQILQNQINPHFLYNTLDSVKWLATIQNVPNISEMVTSLINLLRYNLLDTDRLTTLAEEIEGVKNYIVIQKYRYGNIFTVSYNISESIMSCKILRFILQPIVENAIYHGFENLSKQGAIEINAYQTDQNLTIEVIDNGSGPGIDNIGENIVYQRSDSFNGIGLNNIQERIQLYFGAQYGLKLFAGENNKGTIVTITVPFIT